MATSHHSSGPSEVVSENRGPATLPSPSGQHRVWGQLSSGQSRQRGTGAARRWEALGGGTPWGVMTGQLQE